MLAPLVFPEALIRAILVFPVNVHVVEYVGATRCLQNLGDVGVLSGLIAVLVIRAIAVIRPEVESKLEPVASGTESKGRDWEWTYQSP